MEETLKFTELPLETQISILRKHNMTLMKQNELLNEEVESSLDEINLLSKKNAKLSYQIDIEIDKTINKTIEESKKCINDLISKKSISESEASGAIKVITHMLKNNINNRIG